MAFNCSSLQEKNVVIEINALLLSSNWWYSCLFLILGGISNGFLDRLSNEVSFNETILKNLNPHWWVKDLSWKNKYKLDNKGEPIKLSSGKLKPRFWKSTTWFVFITDGWHLVQFMQWTFISLAAAFLTNTTGLSFVIVFLFLRILIPCGFTVSYNLLLKKKN